MLGLFLSVSHALAQEKPDPVVRILDSSFTTDTDHFSTCPVTIGIEVLSNAGPYNIIAVEPDGITTHLIASNLAASSSWRTYTFTCTKTGWWTVKAGSASIPFGVGSFFVVPFAPLGPLLTLLTACAVLGFFRFKRKVQ